MSRAALAVHDFLPFSVQWCLRSHAGLGHSTQSTELRESTMFSAGVTWLTSRARVNRCHETLGYSDPRSTIMPSERRLTIRSAGPVQTAFSPGWANRKDRCNSKEGPAEPSLRSAS